MTIATSSMADTITRTLVRTNELANALLADVKADQFSSMPKSDGKTINTNHAAFVYGHLSLYPKLLLGFLGKDASAIEHPPKFAELFMHGIDCVDDRSCETYPGMDEIVEYFNRAHKFAIETIQSMSDEELNTQFTGDEWYVEFAKTPASLCIFMLHDHYMFHLGQMSAWRRCFGLGHAMG